MEKIARRLSILLVLWSFSLLSPAFACRYNVRDVGFVDLGANPFFLLVFTNKETPQEFLEAFKEVSYAALLESNVKVEIIDVDRQKNHPAMKYFRLWRLQSLPAAIFLAPSGRSLVIPLAAADKPLKESLWTSLGSLVSSPKRNEILKQIPQAFGIMLLIEGPRAEENSRLLATIGNAIEQIRAQMQWMPKPIAAPPVLVTVPRDQFSRERILLWSLGFQPDKAQGPSLAVLYGRARRMGPLFSGEEITDRKLFGVFSFIGADCECELDRSWLHGPLLPIIWDKKIQSQTARALGFDPESPMVKMEISQILRQGAYTAARAQGLDPMNAPPLGYQEMEVKFEPASEEQDPPAQGTGEPDPAAASGEETNRENKREEEESGALQNTLITLGGLCLLVLTLGAALILKSKRG